MASRILFDWRFKMQSFNKQVLSIFVLLASLLFISEAHAHRNWHSRWGWGAGVGFIGGAVVPSQYPRPYYYQPYPPQVVYQQPIVLHPSPVSNYQILPPAATKSSIWYFCESENNFYPNVATCPEAWKPIQTDSSTAYIPQVPPPTFSVTQ